MQGEKENGIGIRKYLFKCVLRKSVYKQIYKLCFFKISIFRLEIRFENDFHFSDSLKD